MIVGDLLDRLGMLQRVRAQALADAAQFSFPVTNGREHLTYRVKVEGRETVNIGPLAVPAWKVSFAGFHLNKRGEQEAAHRPAIIWFSEAPEHIPLRADSDHPVGLFRIELHPPSALQHLAFSDADGWRLGCASVVDQSQMADVRYWAVRFFVAAVLQRPGVWWQGLQSAGVDLGRRGGVA